MQVACGGVAVVLRLETPEPVPLRESVGSTEASNGRLARVGVVGPTRAARQSVQVIGLHLREPGGVAWRRCHVQADESGDHDRQVDLPDHRFQRRGIPGEPGRRGDLRAVRPGQRRIGEAPGQSSIRNHHGSTEERRTGRTEASQVENSEFVRRAGRPWR